MAERTVVEAAVKVSPAKFSGAGGQALYKA